MSAAPELELESEFELEGEGEFEAAGELEQELESALGFAGELELEHEQEAEHEAFFNNLAAMADRTGRSQALRRIALAAARSAIKGQKPWPVIEGEGELGEFELEGEFGEFELGELESAHELELELSPAQQTEIAAMMEHAGHAAAEAANEQEAAEHFLPLIGLAAKFVLPKLAGLAAKKLGGLAAKKIGGKLIGRVGGQLLRRVAPRLIRRVSPQLTRGIANVTRTLFRNRATRPLIHSVPRIARTTVARLGRQIAAGRRVTPKQAVRTLARQTARTLGNPRTLAQTYKRSLALDRRFHRRTRRVLGRPVGAPVRTANEPASLAGAAPGGIAAGSFGATAPGLPSAPFAPVGSPGFGPVVTGSGGCRCVCQPVGGAVPVSPILPSAGPGPIPQAMPQAPATCPTCGR